MISTFEAMWWRRSKDDRGLDGIRVATMHRVKGLEFQYVFVVAANKKIIPLASAIDHTDAVSEQETMTAEKCLLYVALTRGCAGCIPDTRRLLYAFSCPRKDAVGCKNVSAHSKCGKGRCNQAWKNVDI